MNAMTTKPNTSALAASTMLATLNISVWSARKLDRTATAKTTNDAGAVADAARVNKHLMAGQDTLLRAVATVASAARGDHYALTLPWSDNGPRILSVELWKDLTRKLQDHALAFQAAVDAFIEDYAQARERARFQLGALFSETDYPAPAVVAQKFSFNFEFDPLPTAGDFRAELTDADADMIRKEIEARAAGRVATAMRDVWSRLYENVARITATLPAYEAGNVKRFNDTIITNLRDMLAILPGLNITGDAALAAIADRAQTELAGLQPQTLRDDPTARSRATASATAICATMARHLGIDGSAPAAAPAAPATPAPAAPGSAVVYDLFTAPVRAA